MTTNTTSQDFFERKYQAEQDPWRFASAPYELERYATILAALGDRRAVETPLYGRAFEPGCSIGVLTAQLAPLCDTVAAMDIAPSAVEQAKERCQSLPNVDVRCGALPQIPFAGDFDLIVFSEIGYYFEANVLSDLTQSLVARLRPGGVLLAAHWLGHSPDHLLNGEDVHEIIGSLDRLKHEHSERHAGFRIDRWRLA